MVVDYSKGKIYKIISSQTESVYVGSTCQNLISQRLATHVQGYKRFLNGKYGCNSSFEIIKLEDYKCVLIEEFPCNSSDQLRSREQFWIEHFGELCVNNQRAFRTPEEKIRQNKLWEENNMEKRLEQHKINYQNNKEKRDEQRKLYEQNKKIKIAERKKIFRQEDKEKLAEKYENNKDKINQRRR